MSNLGRIKAGGAEVEVILKDQQFQRAIRHVEYRMRQLKTSLPSFSLTRPIVGFRQMTKAVDLLGRSIKTLGDRIKVVANAFQAVGRSFIAGGIAGLFAVALPTKEYIAFSDQMQILRAVSGATADEMERLVAQARGLGKTTSFSPQEVGAGQVELARGGFSPQEIEDSTSSILSLAKATNTDLAVAGNTGIRIVRGFNLEASEMGHVVDVVAATVNGSAQVIEDYADAIKLVGSIASETGTSLEEASAIIGLLADNGIKGTLAGTGLRRILLNLASPVQQQQFESLLQSFGKISPTFKTAEGDLRPLLDIFDELNVVTADLGSAEKIAAFEQLFGRGTNAALKLSSATQRVRELAKFLGTDIDGVAAKIAEVMDARIGGAFRRMRSAIQDTWLAIGAALEPVLSGLFDIGSQLTLMVNDFVSASSWMVAAFAAIAVGAVLAGGSLLALGLSIGFVGFVISGLGAVLQAVGVILGALSSPLGLVGLALATAATGFLTFTETGRNGMKFLQDAVLGSVARIKDSLGGVFDAISAGDAGLAFRIVADTAQAEMLRLQGFLDANFGGMIDWFRETFSADGAASIAQMFTEPFTTAFADISQAVAPLWQSFTDSISNASKAVGDAQDAMASRVADSWMSVTDTLSVVSAAFHGFFQGLHEAYVAPIGPLNDEVDNLLSPIVSLFRAVSGGINSSFDPGIAKLNDEIDGMAMSARNAMGVVIEFGHAVDAAVVQLFSDTWANIKTIFSGLDGLLRFAMGPFDDWLDDTVNDVNSELGGMVNNVLGWFTGLASGIVDSIYSIVSPVAEVTRTIFGGMYSAGVWAFGSLGRFFAAIFEQFMGIMFNFGVFVELLWGNIVEYFNDAFGGIGTDFARAVDGMFGSWASFIGGIKKLWAAVGTYLLQSIMYIVDALAGIVDYFTEILGFNLDLQASTKAAQGHINQGLQDRFDAIEAEAGARKRQSDDKRARKERQNKLDLGEVELRLQEARLEAKEAYEKKLAKIAQAEVLKQRFDPSGNPNEAGDVDAEGSETVKKQIGAIGSFNIAALNRIGFGSSFEKQSIDLAKQTAKHTKEVAENTRKAIKAT